MQKLDILSSKKNVDYKYACDFMQSKVIAIKNNEARDCAWMLEHDPIYTGGRSAQDSDILNSLLYPYTFLE